MARIFSINIGTPDWIRKEGARPFRSSLLRKPVPGKIFLDYLGFEGDQVADPVHHGGPHKAVLAYSMDHFPFWNEEMGTDLKPGCFGENLTLEGITEAAVCIGDIFEVGEARIQCSQPRQPCHKLNKVFDRQEMACRVQKTGFTGFYCRVLQQGWVKPGDALRRIEAGASALSVERANQLLRGEDATLQEIQDALALQVLAEDWKKGLKKRLNRAMTKISPPS
ncbi:MAG: MOSC domain-containing protein [Nitrospinaceae bacterium]